MVFDISYSEDHHFCVPGAVSQWFLQWGHGHRDRTKIVVISSFPYLGINKMTLVWDTSGSLIVGEGNRGWRQPWPLYHPGVQSAWMRSQRVLDAVVELGTEDCLKR